MEEAVSKEMKLGKCECGWDSDLNKTTVHQCPLFGLTKLEMAEVEMLKAKAEYYRELTRREQHRRSAYRTSGQ